MRYFFIRLLFFKKCIFFSAETLERTKEETESVLRLFINQWQSKEKGYSESVWTFRWWMDRSNGFLPHLLSDDTLHCFYICFWGTWDSSANKFCQLKSINDTGILAAFTFFCVCIKFSLLSYCRKESEMHLPKTTFTVTERRKYMCVREGKIDPVPFWHAPLCYRFFNILIKLN